MCNCMVLDVTAIFFWITAFLKKLPFLAKGLGASDISNLLASWASGSSSLMLRAEQRHQNRAMGSAVASLICAV